MARFLTSRLVRAARRPIARLHVRPLELRCLPEQSVLQRVTFFADLAKLVREPSRRIRRYKLARSVRRMRYVRARVGCGR